MNHASETLCRLGLGRGGRLAARQHGGSRDRGRRCRLAHRLSIVASRERAIRLGGPAVLLVWQWLARPGILLVRLRLELRLRLGRRLWLERLGRRRRLGGRRLARRRLARWRLARRRLAWWRLAWRRLAWRRLARRRRRLARRWLAR